MTTIDRRSFGKLIAGAGAAASAPFGLGAFAIAQGAAKVVIVGGGPGGATVAHFVKKEAPQLDVSLIEVRSVYTTCFFSNLYLGGFRTYESLQHSYDGLRKLGVKVITSVATDVDTAKKAVKLRDGRMIPYDKLVLSPGIDFKFDSIKGYNADAIEAMPHAYKPGSQTTLLKRKLEAMRDGGVVVMAPPMDPYRCPPGPYERAAMIAHYLKMRKPKSKLIILDPKRSFSKQGPFQEAYKKYYAGIIEHRLSDEIDNHGVVEVDVRSSTVTTKKGDKIRADVANIIPNQKAGEIAFKAGVTEGDWCPINPASFVSRKNPDIFVLGDSSVAVPMPKSGFSANSQAKLVAGTLLQQLASKEEPLHRLRNTCWSLVGPQDTILVGANYPLKDGKLEASGGFVSKPGEDAALRKKNFEDSVGWYTGITTETFAKATPAPAPAPKGSGSGAAPAKKK